jgi:hypothetical protein
LQNNGSIDGSVDAATVSDVGSISGTLTLNVPAKAFPVAGVAESYAALGQQISPPSSIQSAVLGPGINPWGAANAEGVYVIRPSGDVTIRNSRIYGTLVVICAAGKRVVIQDSVLIHPYRADYPSLIIAGNAVFEFSSSLDLSELLLLKNFNPPGAPYQGSSDSDLLDAFPSEIQGLVHVTGTANLKVSARIRGVLLCESAAAADAVKCDSSNTIVYQPSLFANPAQWYTSAVYMRPQPGGWRQVTE